MLSDVVRTSAYEQALRSVIKPHHRVLDFGCGTGWTAPILTASGARYLGIDPSADLTTSFLRLAAGDPSADPVALDARQAFRHSRGDFRRLLNPRRILCHHKR